MSKTQAKAAQTALMARSPGPPKLTPRDMRSLYSLREPYVDQIVDTAVMLDEHDRKLAVRMLQALIEHRRSSLS